MAPDLSRRVAITGAGAVGVFGLGTEALWDWLDAGRAEFAPCSRWPGELPYAESVKPDLRCLLRSGRFSRISLVSQFAIAAAHLALEQAGILAGRGAAGERAVGIVYGTSNGPSAATREIYDDLIDHGPAGVKPRAFQESVFNAPASLTSIHFGLKGPIQVLAANPCAPPVLYQAQMLLAHPGVEAVIALCADALSEIIQRTLRILRWHAPPARTGGLPRPGDGRGAVSSEGAAALVLERGDGARARGAAILAEMAGAASTNDAWRLVRPAGDGRGLAAAMRECLADAGAAPEDVDMILSSSANTAVDDALEAAAVRSVFGEAAPPMAWARGHIGNAMGTATMIDVALAVEAVRRDRVPAPVEAAAAPKTAGGFARGGIGSVLCAGIGLNGLFGAILIRRAAW